jgi:hypothetical protein
MELTMDIPTQKRWTKMRKKMISLESDFQSLTKLRESITMNGLLHPISVLSVGKILNIYKGIEQVWVAKTEGYTHISAYVIDKKDMDIVNPPETNWLSKKEYLGKKAMDEHRKNVFEWLKERGKSRSTENLEEASAIIEKESFTNG